MISDRRVKYTRQVIKESLLQLLENNSLKEITVKHLCETADINRTTFYRHYVDLFDLFEQIEIDFIKEIQIHGNEIESIQTLLTLVYQHQGFYKEFFSNHLESERIKKVVYETREALKRMIQKDEDDKVINIHIQFVYHGVIGSIKDWVGTGCQSSPEVFYEILHNIIENMTA